MITAVITCMGRREHLEMSLPLALSTFNQVVVVDWSCPQNSGEYASEEGASVIYQYGEHHFSCSKAKNLGASLVTSEYIAFVDADFLCMPELRSELKRLIAPDRMVLSARNADGSDISDTAGFIVCPTAAFRRVGGFDERWIGWGGDDIQLRGKLFLEASLKVVRVSGMALGAIAHSNLERSAYHSIPIEKAAPYNHLILKDWFASKGIQNYLTNPAVKDIVCLGPNHDWQ